MHGVPADFDPAALRNRYLAKISFGQGSVHLDLSRVASPGKGDSISVVILGRYSYEIGGVAFEADASKPSSGTGLVGLLNRDVTQATIIDSGDLSIEFGLGHRVVAAEDRNFESYAIYLPGQKEIVV